MGWGSGVNFRGEDVGYTHDAVCEEPGCEEQINKGLSYCCGDLAGVIGERGCGHYFCNEHLFYSDDREARQLCLSCLAVEEDDE